MITDYARFHLGPRRRPGRQETGYTRMALGSKNTEGCVVHEQLPACVPAAPWPAGPCIWLAWLCRHVLSACLHSCNFFMTTSVLEYKAVKGKGKGSETRLFLREAAVRVHDPVPGGKHVADGRARAQERVVAAGRKVRDCLWEAAHEMVQSFRAGKARHASCQVLQNLQTHV